MQDRVVLMVVCLCSSAIKLGKQLIKLKPIIVCECKLAMLA